MKCYKISLYLDGVFGDVTFYTIQNTIQDVIIIAESACNDYNKRNKKSATVNSIFLLGESIEKLRTVK